VRKPKEWTIPRYHVEDTSEYDSRVEMLTVVLKQDYEDILARWRTVHCATFEEHETRNESLRLALEEQNRLVVKAAENYDRINDLRNESMADCKYFAEQRNQSMEFLEQRKDEISQLRKQVEHLTGAMHEQRRCRNIEYERAEDLARKVYLLERKLKGLE
jgi:hypothetical protein